MGCRSSKMKQLEVPSARGRKHSRGTTPGAVRGVKSVPVINSRENSLEKSEYSHTRSASEESSMGISSEQLSRHSVMSAAHVALEDVVEDSKFVGLGPEELKDVPIRTLLHLMENSSPGGAYDFSDLPLRAFLGLLSTPPPSTTVDIHIENNKQSPILREYLEESISHPVQNQVRLQEYIVETVSHPMTQSTEPVVLKEYFTESVCHPFDKVVSQPPQSSDACEVSCQTETETAACSASASPMKKPPLPSASPSLSAADKRPSLGSVIAASSPLQLPSTALPELLQQQIATPKKKTSSRKSHRQSPSLRSASHTPQSSSQKASKTSKRRTSSPGKGAKKERAAPTVHLQPCLQMQVKVLQKRDKNTHHRVAKKDATKRPVARALTLL